MSKQVKKQTKFECPNCWTPLEVQKISQYSFQENDFISLTCNGCGEPLGISALGDSIIILFRKEIFEFRKLDQYFIESHNDFAIIHEDTILSSTSQYKIIPARCARLGNYILLKNKIGPEYGIFQDVILIRAQQWTSIVPKWDFIDFPMYKGHLAAIGKSTNHRYVIVPPSFHSLDGSYFCYGCGQLTQKEVWEKGRRNIGLCLSCTERKQVLLSERKQFHPVFRNCDLPEWIKTLQ